MINFILLFGTFIICGQTSVLKLCEVCITDSSCTDDKIYFNVSISKYCPQPLHTYFTYLTDVNSKSYHYNITSFCSDCYISIVIDSIRDAWDYTLTLKSPKPSEHCPAQQVAHCGGSSSQLIWFITGGLSGLSLVLGVLLCCIKHCRSPKEPVKTKKKKKTVEVAVINV